MVLMNTALSLLPASALTQADLNPITASPRGAILPTCQVIAFSGLSHLPTLLSFASKPHVDTFNYWNPRYLLTTITTGDPRENILFSVLSRKDKLTMWGYIKM